MSAPAQGRGGAGVLPRILHGAAVLALALLGLGDVHAGLERRLAAEPPALVAGAGLLPGVDGPEDTEIRTPGLLALPGPHLAAAGASERRRGTGLMAAALALAVFGRPRSTGLGLALRLLWSVPGAGALLWSASRAAASAPTASHALEAFGAAAPAYAVSLLLVLAWRP